MGYETGGFVSCGSCEEGWVRVWDGFTGKGNPVDRKTGGVTRCQCWLDWIATKIGATVARAAVTRPATKQVCYEESLEAQKEIDARISALNAQMKLGEK